MNDQTPEQPATSEQPTSEAPAASEAPVVETPTKNRFAWVSSPKVAAAAVITVLALGGLGGAFALGRATAGHDHGELIMVGIPGGFDGRGMPGPGMQGPGGWGERGPMLREHRQELQDQAPESTPSPSAPSSSKG